MVARQLEEELERVEASDAREILVDLSALRFIDSAGMNVFIHASGRSRSHGNRLKILRGPDCVHRAFEICGLATRLPFIDDAELTALP